VHELKRTQLTRIVADPSALDQAAWHGIVLRVAPDEALLLSDETPDVATDPHSIVQRDDGFSAMWLPMTEARELLAKTCDWELPAQRPAFAQGSVAGLPVKLWFEQDRVLFLVPAPYAHDFLERVQ